MTPYLKDIELRNYDVCIFYYFQVCHDHLDVVKLIEKKELAVCGPSICQKMDDAILRDCC